MWCTAELSVIVAVPNAATRAAAKPNHQAERYTSVKMLQERKYAIIKDSYTQGKYSSTSYTEIINKKQINRTSHSGSIRIAVQQYQPKTDKNSGCTLVQAKPKKDKLCLMHKQRQQ